MTDPREVLRREFAGGDGTFLYKLRVDLRWDKEHFRRLEEAMRAVAESLEGDETRERWMAEGFHYMSYFPRNWTNSGEFERGTETEYYERCFERLQNVAYWFFAGFNPYAGELDKPV